MARMRRREISEATGEEVPSEHIAKGFDLGGGRYLIVTDDDLAPLARAKSKEIELETFVPTEEIDPVMFDASYLVLPDKTAKPYALLAAAMAGGGRVAIGRFVMRQKEYLAAIRSDGTHLTLSTLVFPDELIDIGSVDEFDTLETVEVGERELSMAKSLVDALSESFEPARYVDEYRLSVEAIIQRKAAGAAPLQIEAPTQKSNVIDLASALEASLLEAQASRVRHPTGRAASSMPNTPSAGPKKRPVAKTAKAAPPAKRVSTKSVPAKAAAPKKAVASRTPATIAATVTAKPRVRKSA
jgi:DNA end-binding protein Ku